MYIIFDYKIGVFQIGFRALKSINIQHGIFFSNNFQEIYSDEFYYKDGNLYIIDNKFFLVNKTNILLKDYRINFKIRSFKYFFKILLNIVFIIKKYKIKLKKLYRLTLLLLIFFNIFPVFNILRKNSNYTANSSNWVEVDWVQFFRKSKTADYISQNKFDYISSEIPSIKGILEFRVLPLNNRSSTVSHFKANIALPYNRIILLNIDKSVKKIEPKYYCDKRSIYFYEIDENSDILILEKNYFKGINYDYYIFHDDYQIKVICEEEENAKHQIEE